jgi:hypothetical protein
MAHSGACPPSEPAMTLSAAWAIRTAGPDVIENIIKLQPTMARTAFMSDNSLIVSTAEAHRPELGSW